MYGLRQQADLVRLAIQFNVEPLLPPGLKSTEYKEVRHAEKGLRIKGTGIGQKVKGHKWERSLEKRLEDRKRAMMEMPELIRLWKQVSTIISLRIFTHLMLFSFLYYRYFLLCLDMSLNSFVALHYSVDTVVAGRSGPGNKNTPTINGWCFLEEPSPILSSLQFLVSFSTLIKFSQTAIHH